MNGAQVYYIRNCIHDFPDDKAIALLRSIRKSKGPESVLIIDEMVIPAQGARWKPTQLGMLMMMCLTAQERTEEQFRVLTNAAGLKTRKIRPYEMSANECVIECMAA